MKMLVRLGVCACAVVTPIFAQEVHVPGDHPTIQEAIDAATSDVVILISAGTYSETLVNDKSFSVTLRGEGARPEDTQVVSDGSAPALTALEFGTLIVENLQLSNGYALGTAGLRGGNLLARTGSELTLRRVIVRNGTAPLGGGGVYAEDVLQITIENCAFVENMVNSSSGNSILIRTLDRPLNGNISYTTFADAQGILAWAVDFENGGADGTFVIDSSIFSNTGPWATSKDGELTLTANYLCLHPITYTGNHQDPFLGGATLVPNPTLFYRDPEFVAGEFYHPGQCSPSIDTGDPGDDVGDEPDPNGERANMGFYGRTELAQTSLITDVLIDSNNDLRLDATDEASETDEEFVFWINNDDDSLGGDDWKGTNPDSGNQQIDGIRDLEDFARIRLEALCDPGPEDVEYFLRIVPVEGVNETPTIRLFEYPRNDLEYVRSRSVARDVVGQSPVILEVFGGGTTTVVGQTPVKLPDDFLTPGSPKVLLFEGVSKGSGRLELIRRIRMAAATPSSPFRMAGQDTVLIRLEDIFTESEDPKLFSVVRVNRSTYQHQWIYPNNQPPPHVESVTVFVHGYNVTPVQSHRSWFCTIYKRLYWAGHRSHLVGVNWPGDVFWINFNDAVFHAFRSAGATAQAINEIAASRVDLLAHSAGNIVVADALRRIENDPLRVRHFNSMEAAIAANVFNIQTRRSLELWEGGVLWGLFGVDHGLGDQVGSPWSAQDELDLTTVGSIQDVNDDLWVGIYQSDIESSGILLSQLWSGADFILRGLIANEVKKRAPTIVDRTRQAINATWTALAYVFPMRCVPYGLRGVPEAIPQSFNTRRQGILGHSHCRERPIQAVHEFFDLLIQNELLVGVPPYN